MYKSILSLRSLRNLESITPQRSRSFRTTRKNIKMGKKILVMSKLVPLTHAKVAGNRFDFK